MLAEHAGVREREALGRIDGLVDTVDAFVASPESKLRRPAVRREVELTRQRPLRLERIFDPDKPLTDVDLEVVPPH